MKKDRLKLLINTSTIVGTMILCLFFYYAIKYNLFTSEEAMKNFLDRAGIFGPFSFIIIQIIQVIVPLIPGGISCGVGVLVFGTINGFIYNYIGIVIGSIIVFLISRKYGIHLIKRMFKKELIEKYIGWLDENRRFDVLFAIAIFMPVSPDDFLCYLAGITNISFKKYLLIILILKPFTIFAYSLGLVWLSSLFI